MFERSPSPFRLLAAVVCCLVVAGPAAGAVSLDVGGSASTQSPPALPGNGTAENPYRISNATGLQAMAEAPDAHYVLAADVNASVTAGWNGGSGFVPIGEFTGTFDGRGHNVTGLTIRRRGTDRVGLFGELATAGVVENLRLVSPTVRGGRFTGALVGHARGSVRDVRITGARVEGTTMVGGAVGRTTGTVSGVVVTGTVTGSERVGGVVGESVGGRINRSGARATVRGTTVVGGLVGASTGSIRTSYAAGEVSGERRVGGIVGAVTAPAASVADVYSTAAVSGQEEVGGLVGRLASGTLRKAFAVGPVQGDDLVGSLVGTRGEPAYLESVYWNAEATNRVAGIGSAGSDGTARERDEMTGEAALANLGALEYGERWVTTNRYPVLRWQIETVSLSAPEQIVVGEAGTVTATLRLTDGRTVNATGTVVYRTNGSALSVDRGVVTTASNGTVQVTAIVPGHAGSATVSVVTPADIAFVNATLSHDRVGAETAAPIQVTLDNDGGATGSYEVAIQVDGRTVATRTVSVAGHTTRTATLDWTPPSTGSYRVAIEGSTLGTLTVVPEPETSVASGTVSASTVRAGENVTVTATLENAGDAAASHEVTLTADGSAVATRTVLVPPGGTTVSFDWSTDSAGEYALAVDGVSAGTVTVATVGTVELGAIDAPDQVQAGESYEITVALENTGGIELTANLTYLVAGETVAEGSVVVPANGTTVTFEHAVDSAMTHVVRIDDSDRQFRVDVGTPTPTPADMNSSVNVTTADAGGATGPDTDGTPATGTDSGTGPGFGPVVALLGMLALVTGWRRLT